MTFWYHEVTPEVFSVFEREHRTNNLVESWHKIFNVLCVVAHPNFWDFMRNYSHYIDLLLTALLIFFFV